VFSRSEPAINTPIIGALLNLYDVAVVQEDFAFHSDLAGGAAHPYRSEPLLPASDPGIGDGLTVFSRMRLSRPERVTWTACNGRFSDGWDCLAPKGFLAVTCELFPGVELDLYDVHFDSGGSKADILARRAQLEQLLQYLERRSPGRAVVIAGDTNMGRESEGLVQGLLLRAGLTDACRSLSCDRPSLIDRVMYRGSSQVHIAAKRFIIDDRFVRKDGAPLSDHDAIGVTLVWSPRALVKGA
jgi:hypothetical protein